MKFFRTGNRKLSLSSMTALQMADKMGGNTGIAGAAMTKLGEHWADNDAKARHSEAERNWAQRNRPRAKGASNTYTPTVAGVSAVSSGCGGGGGGGGC